MNSAKIMEMTVAGSDIRFIDSLNFLPMALSKLIQNVWVYRIGQGILSAFL